jgi:uncharacterized membrane protein
LTHRDVGAGSGFERAISYLLIIGVITSLILELIGMIFFYHIYGNLDVSENGRMFILGDNFFNFMHRLFRGEYAQDRSIFIMVLGISILILTPYLRVIMSVFYFIYERNFKYAAITLFVLMILTISLIAH